MYAKRFLNYKEPSPVRASDLEIDRHCRVLERGTVAIEGLLAIRDVVDKNKASRTVTEYEFIDLAIESVLTDFNQSEIDEMLLDTKQLALESGSSSDNFFIAALKKIWNGIVNSIKWLLSKVGFSFSDSSGGGSTSVVQAKKKFDEKYANFVKFVKDNETELKSIGEVSITDKAVLSRLEHLNTTVGPKYLDEKVNDLCAIILLINNGMEKLEGAAGSMVGLIDSVTKSVDEKSIAKVIDSFNYLEDLGGDHLSRDNATNVSERVINKVKKSGYPIKGLRATPAFLTSDARGFYYREALPPLKDLKDVPKISRLLYVRKSYAKKGTSSISGFSVDEILKFKYLANDFVNVFNPSIKAIENYSTMIKKQLELAGKNSEDILKKIEDLTDSDNRKMINKVSSSIAPLITLTTGQVRSFQKLHGDAVTSFGSITGIMHKLMEQVESKVKKTQSKDSKDDKDK